MHSLQNKRVVITRAKSQARSFADKLKLLGAEPILFPTIKISPIEDYTLLDAALNNLDQYDWLILTSMNAVYVVTDRLKILGIDQLPENMRTACIGPKTAAAFKSLGFHSDFMPEKYVAESMMAGLSPVRKKQFLLPQADIARKYLSLSIREQGGSVDALTAYKTMPASASYSSVEDLRAEVDVITFTSPSTVLNFASIVKNSGLDLHDLPGAPIFACIGPITAEVAEDLHLPVALVPDQYTIESLIESLTHYYNEEKKDYDY